MWRHLKPVLIFWLLAVLLSLFYIKLLQAEKIDQNIQNIKQNPVQLLNSLDQIILKQGIELENSKKQLRLWQGQFTTLEAQHKILVDQSTQQQDIIQVQEKSLTTLKDTMQNMDNAHNDDISHLKLSRIEWCVGGFVVGFSAGILIYALVIN